MRSAREHRDGRRIAPRGSRERAWNREGPAIQKATRSGVRIRSNAALVGRERELERLLRHFEQARSVRPQVAVLHGDAGAGKTRLVHELIERTAGVSQSYVGRCVAQLDAPYAPIVMMLARALADGRLAGEREHRIRDLVHRLTSAEDASLREGAPQVERSTGRLRLFLELSEALRGLVGDRPTILVLEDLHWIDHSSARFLEFFALELLERAPRLPLLLVFTLRAWEPEHRGLERVEQFPACSSLTLGPLDELEVHDLIRGYGVSRPGRQLVSMLYGASGGNPLYVYEVLRRLQALDAFTEQHGQIEAHASSRELSPPSDLTELIEHRLQSVPPDVLALLRLGAILGEEIQPELLSLLHGGDVTTAVEHALDSGLLVAKDGQLAFVNPLVRQVAYERLSRPDRRKLHGRVAAALRDSDDPVSHTRAIAHHLLESGEEIDREGLECIWRAGLQDHRVAAWRSAIRYFDAAIALGERLGVPRPNVGWFRYWAGRSRREDYDAAAAVELLREAAQIGKETGDIELWCRAVDDEVRHRMTTRLPTSDSRRIDTDALDEVLAHLDETRPGLRGPLLATSCTVHMTSLDTQKGLAMGEEAVRLAHAAGDAAQIAHAESTLGMAFLGIGEAARACEYLERAERAASELGDRETEALSAGRRAIALWMLGHVDRAELAAERAARGFDALRHRGGQCLVAAIRAALAIVRGDFAAGEIWGQRSEALYAQSQYYFAPLLLYPALAEARSSLGDHDGAAAALTAWGATGQGGRFLSRLVALVRCGRLDDARERLRTDPRPLLVARVRSMATAGVIGALTEVAQALDDAALAVALHEIVAKLPDDGVVLSPGSNHLLVWCRGVLAGLLGDPERAESWLEQAVSAADRMGAPPELGRSHLALGKLLAADPERCAEAASHLASALDIFERLGMGADAGATRALRDRLPSLPTRAVRRPKFILMSDLVSSTRISAEQGDEAYLELVDAHNAILRTQLRKHGGREVDTAGDGMLAWLDSADAAVRCALAVQEEVRRRAQDATGPRLEIRIGLVEGHPIERAGRLYGSAVNLSARLCKLAEPGQIVVTGGVVAELRDGIRSERLGDLILHGFATPVEVHRLHAL